VNHKPHCCLLLSVQYTSMCCVLGEDNCSDYAGNVRCHCTEYCRSHAGGFCTLASVHNLLVYMQNITTYGWGVQLWAVSLTFDQLHLITCIFDV
jgi:hypothetical protein